MKSRADLALLLLVAATPASAQEPPAGDGPRGSSQAQPGEIRYDRVGYAEIGDAAGMTAVSSDIAAGSYAEVTAIDSGRTIVVAVTSGAVPSGRLVALSGAAAAALGLSGDSPAVRVRKVTVTPQDMALLREGQAASSRVDAPPVLLTALRRKLPALQTAVASQPDAPPKLRTAAPAARAPVATPKPAPAEPAVVTSGYVVQVAALSSAARAAVVARAVGGTVVAGPPVWRVRMGPYPDAATAARAKADAARKGYAGGQISRIP
ncbi:MAG: SPOR domain-containing protein [Pseudomonadota bacterium]